MKRKLASFLLACCVVLGVCTTLPAQAASAVKVTVNDEAVQFTASSGSPFVDKNKRTQVPLRATMEAMGAIVGWNSYDRAASVTKDGVTVIVPIGKKYVFVNGVQKSCDTAAQIVNNRTYIPIRVVAESVGAQVSWDDSSRTVDITVDDVSTWLDYGQDVSQFIGKKLAAVFTRYGYNSTETWSSESYAPTILLDEYGLGFSVEWDTPAVSLDKPSTWHNPNLRVYSVTSYDEYPIWSEFTGNSTFAEIRDVVPDATLRYDSDSESGSRYYVSLVGTNRQTNEKYDIEFIWLDGYPDFDTPASYAVLMPYDGWAIFY